MSKTVRLKYNSFSNISFRGEIDTGIPWDEWDEMSGTEQSDIINEELNALVEIWVVDDE